MRIEKLRNRKIEKWKGSKITTAHQDCINHQRLQDRRNYVNQFYNWRCMARGGVTLKLQTIVTHYKMEYK